MTTFSNISDAEIDNDSPLDGALFTKIRNNQRALAEGDNTVSNQYRINPRALNNVIAGDYLVQEHTKTLTAKTSSYEKAIEYYINRQGTWRVWLSGFAYFGSATNVNFRVYKNGSAVGTVRGISSGPSLGTLSPVSEDFSGLVVGDLLQVYVDSSSSTAAMTSTSVTAQFCQGNPVDGGVNVTV